MDRIMYSPIDIDLLIVMDTTFSMQHNIDAAKARAKTILEEFQDDPDVATLRAGFIAYRDYDDEFKSYLTNTHPLTDNLTNLQNFINKLNADGGDDACEAWDSAAVEINTLFRSGTKGAGRIVAWIADDAPHGSEYNCGRDDTQRPIRADLKAEIEEAIENDAHFYFMLYPPMSTILPCVSKYLKPWGEILPLGNDARDSSADDIKAILHHGVLQAIARRGIRDGIKKGKSREEIIDGLIESGIPSRDLDLDGDKITTRDSDLTRSGAGDLFDKAIRIKPKKAKDIADRIFKGRRDEEDDNDWRWLRPFVELLGDEIRSDEENDGIQFVHSKQYPLSRDKNGKNRLWWALDESRLDEMDDDEFLEFLSWVQNERGGVKTIYLTNCGRSKVNKPMRKKVLADTSRTKVIELKKGGIAPPPIPPIPRPWPYSPNPVNPPGPDPDGDSDFNCVPGIPDANCRPYLLVIPEVDCDKLQNSDYRFDLEKYPDRRVWDCDEHHEWEPDVEEMHPEEREESLAAWRKMRHCFCRILESAINHAASCLERSNGKMNQTIIVQMSRRGIDMGLLTHPCYKSFKTAVKTLDKRWKHVDGVTLEESEIDFSHP
jgi:hypothetical protein